MGKEGLIAEFFAQRETILQACWAHQLWSTKKLRTADGRALTVLFQGWLNTGPGPDFLDARILIGDSEHYGDVEIHIEPSGWRAHGHHKDARYDRVMLHVVLAAEKKPPAVSAAGRELPVFEALPHLSLRSLKVMRDPESMLKQYEQLPGRCGLRAVRCEPEAINRVIAHAAEERARQKAERLLPQWDAKPEEQTLFELVFQSLGYRPYAEAFRDMAARFPLLELEPYFTLPYPEARRQVLARWFGALGLLAAEPARDASPEAHQEYRSWRFTWETAGGGALAARPQRGGSRPWNSPERRMVGLFHHIYATGARGWLKGWLAFLHELDGLRDQPQLKKTAMSRLEQAFDTPSWEPWRHRVSFAGAPLRRDARMIGSDRIIIVMANAVLPFFLAYARRRGDSELEKLLYRLFIVLPPEAPNRRTRFMEKRLLVLGALPRTLRMHQGLLQIHQDFCVSFNEGCHDCGFPALFTPARDEATRRPQGGNPAGTDGEIAT